MKLSDKELALNMLLELREIINTSLWSIEDTLKRHFPEEHNNAYQHWIPQIATALYNDTKWLPRGVSNMQNTIDHIKDITDSANVGVSKFIK
jgi:hypothetical protein